MGTDPIAVPRRRTSSNKRNIKRQRNKVVVRKIDRTMSVPVSGKIGRILTDKKVIDTCTGMTRNSRGYYIKNPHAQRGD